MRKESKEDDKPPPSSSFIIGGIGLLSAASLLAFISTRIHTAKASQVLTRAGFLIPKIQTGRVFIRWPFQHIKTISTTADQIQIDPPNLRDSDKIPIKLPTIITTRLREGDPQAIIAHALSFETDDDRFQIISDTVGGMYRPYVGSTTVQNLFAGRDEFQKEMKQQISKALEPFGLEVVSLHNNSITTSGDVDVLGTTAMIEEAKVVAKAKAETAAFEKAGNIAAQEQKTAEKIRLAILSVQVAEQEMIRDTELARLKAQTINAQIAAKLENETKSTAAAQEVAGLKARLEADVAVVEQRQQLEQQRSVELTKTQVRKEQTMMDADGKYYAVIRAAEAEKLKVEHAAIAEKARLEAIASGTEATLMAQAKGMEAIGLALQDRPPILTYLALEKDIQVRIAKEQGAALGKTAMTIYGQGAGNALSEVLTEFGMNLKSMEGAGIPLPKFLSPVLPKTSDKK